MNSEEKVMIPKPEGYDCFACGTANPIGLNLQFYRSGNTINSEITLGKYYVGWANISHGGIISTLLDEVMSWTILYFKRVFFVTRRMEVKYIRPVLVGAHLIIKGQLADESVSCNKLMVKAEIKDDRGSLLARSTGEYVIMNKDDLGPIFDRSKTEIFSMIKNLPPL